MKWREIIFWIAMVLIGVAMATFIFAWFATLPNECQAPVFVISIGFAVIICSIKER